MSQIRSRRPKSASLIIYLDDSPESQKVRAVLSEMKRDFRVIQSSSSVKPVPAIDTGYGLIRGYNNIKRYFAEF